MWLAVIIPIAFFAGLFAIVFHGYWQLEQERSETSAGEADAPAPEREYCPRCNAPLPRPRAAHEFPCNQEEGGTRGHHPGSSV